MKNVNPLLRKERGSRERSLFLKGERIRRAFEERLRMANLLAVSTRSMPIVAVTAVPETATPRPHLDEEPTERGGGEGWIVIVYDNDKNTWDEVMDVLQRATGCTAEEAYIETWEVDNLGKSVVHHGSHEEC